MIRAKLIPKVAFAIALTGAICAGSVSTASAKCKPNPNPICYQLYSPVICSNGVVYTNQCFADAACATGCVPYNQV
jgi:hypothetical protein